MNDKIPILDHGYIQLVESWGSDERIIQAARMSTGKGFLGWDRPCPDCDDGYQSRTKGPTLDLCLTCHGETRLIGDEKLLRFLWTNKHTSPFEQCGLSVEVSAPIMVFREWHRHRTQSYNEMSGRYTQIPDVHYMPERTRIQFQSDKNKQGSGEPVPDSIAQEFQARIVMGQTVIEENYKWALEQGIAKEIARINTPISRYSRMVASANLLNWLKFLKLRMAENAQWEIRQYANALAGIVGELFPRTYALFKEGGA